MKTITKTNEFIFITARLVNILLIILRFQAVNLNLYKGNLK